MLNQVILVGRIDSISKIKTVNKEYQCTVVLKIQMPGQEEPEYIPTILQGDMATATKHLEAGNVIGVKGKLKSNGVVIYLYADRTTFISGKLKGEIDDAAFKTR